MKPFIDLHQDLASSRFHPELVGQTGFKELADAGAKIVLGTGFTLSEENLDETVMRDFGIYEEEFGKDPRWRMIKTKEDVRSVMLDKDARGILFHIEGFQNFTGDMTLLEKWHSKGLRSIGPVWNVDNPLGGGTKGAGGGLTELGKKVIKWCEEREILIDLAHTNPAIFADCMRIVQRPPFISHGGLASIAPHARNFTDEQVQSVIDRGGIFGIFFAKGVMAQDADFSVVDIAGHIKGAVMKFGEDAIALGTDFGGMTSGTPEGLSSVANMVDLEKELLSQGLNDEQVGKIFFGNAERYLFENLPFSGNRQNKGDRELMTK